MLTRWFRSGLLFGAVAAAAITGCASDDAGSTHSARVFEVPAAEPTIQAAVDQARPGDLILVDAGVYREEVTIETPDLTVRGIDRNQVVLDGGHELFNGIEVTASGVTIENLTARNYVYNGVLFNGASENYGSDSETATPAVDGFRVSYVTTANNGLYGVYAFAAQNGEISHSSASGHPDSGFYVGQCKPCDIVLDEVTAEHNAIGYYGTNASGGVYVVNSTFRGNRLGIAPNSQNAELLAPQAETVVAGNLVIGDGADDAPAIAQGLYGGGIAVGGGTRNTIVRNRVERHPAYGIGLVALGPYEPETNRVEGNVLDGNAIDLLYAPSRTSSSAGNCFTDNQFASSAPAEIEDLMPCDGTDRQLQLITPDLPEAPPTVDYREVDVPADQPSMPNARDAPVEVPGPPTVPNVEAITVPPAASTDE